MASCGGGSAIIVVFVSSILVLLVLPCFSHPLCSDSRAPFSSKTPLLFCPYNGSLCCTSAQDLSLQKQFAAMNISHTECASLVKSVLCARCDKFSADLYTVQSTSRQVPLLCNTTTGSNSFCSQVWNTCQNVSIINSPFVATSLLSQPGTPVNSSSKLTDTWKSKNDFCSAFGGISPDDSVCLDGGPVILADKKPPSPPSGMCLEKIDNGSFLNMAAHPDGSNRAFYANQQGKIFLATIPKQGSGEEMKLDESTPFLDLTDEVYFSTEFGMMGMAFHPNFAQNARFFASFNCDKSKWNGCSGRCACNSDVDCDPSKIGTDNGAQPCQYQTVIAEYTANDTNSQPSTEARPIEVRRILTMGLPFTGHHGGQILIGPTDGHLYFMIGDGGGVGDPYNFAQNKKSLLGKIMRLDINTNPSPAEIDRLGLWGNYSIPKDNPYTLDKDLQPEIWAIGMRNPWRCSFDSARPSYFMCADIGQDHYEEVNLVTKDGNYGWRAYEGPNPYNPPKAPGGNTSRDSISPIFPVMGYSHSDVNKNEGSASITGGYFYRSTTDPCLEGRYLYADLYAGAAWAGIETPENSGNFTSTKIPFKCAEDSPIPCTYVPGNTLPALGYIFSFGEDNSKDHFVLASSGVYRVVPPSRCNYSCTKEKATTTSPPTPSHATCNYFGLTLSLISCFVLSYILMI
ncbi:hypothetical protein DCAR_0414492 [Daucus carota subsp. sativus]|uniref:Glucose/Sorbosone dehydrogenase domain-containing protein n=1 Tax=Daucus carota subsp. sativus TaxID=79200 RepID=A0AAF0WUM3_DAUCS|nr:PREDICTED: HIPL1 protein-like isoform X1 [Daucus carota subsp. sativus]WOG95186.1 hypothetical protein DCAR_0414492 [Daucus carota subsp. sativus]